MARRWPGVAQGLPPTALVRRLTIRTGPEKSQAALGRGLWEGTENRHPDRSGHGGQLLGLGAQHSSCRMAQGPLA